MTDHTPPPHKPSLKFNWQDWLPYFEDTDIPETQKRELIETLWSLVLSFVDLGFDLSTTSETCGEAIDLKALLEASVVDSNAPAIVVFNAKAQKGGKDAA